MQEKYNCSDENIIGLKINFQAASEEVITDVAFAKSRREFAYSSADKLIYIRKFSTCVRSWNLLHVLQGAVILYYFSYAFSLWLRAYE